MEFAKDVDDSSSGGRGGRASTVVGGTTDWHAPEVFMGEELANTKGSDVFSLGLVFYFLLQDGDHALGQRGARKRNLIRIYNGHAGED